MAVVVGGEGVGAGVEEACVVEWRETTLRELEVDFGEGRFATGIPRNGLTVKTSVAVEGPGRLLGPACTERKRRELIARHEVDRISRVRSADWAE